MIPQGNPHSRQQIPQTVGGDPVHRRRQRQIAHMVVVEDKDDPDMEWTKDTVDRKLLQIVGPDNFVPWEERMGGDLDAE